MGLRIEIEDAKFISYNLMHFLWKRVLNENESVMTVSRSRTYFCGSSYKFYIFKKMYYILYIS